MDVKATADYASPKVSHGTIVNDIVIGEEV